MGKDNEHEKNEKKRNDNNEKNIEKVDTTEQKTLNPQQQGKRHESAPFGSYQNNYGYRVHRHSQIEHDSPSIHRMIKEQQARIVAQQARIAAQATEIKEQEARIVAQQACIAAQATKIKEQEARTVAQQACIVTQAADIETLRGQVKSFEDKIELVDLLMELLSSGQAAPDMATLSAMVAARRAEQAGTGTAFRFETNRTQ